MSEQYPLLCEDLSEEERHTPQFNRRMTSRARTRNKINGAAAIITRWPEHWTRLLTYWWMGVGMIALSTFLIYNFLFSCALVQSNNVYSRITLNTNTEKSIVAKGTFKQLKVLMHIFVDDKQELNWGAYWPYIEIIANEYTNFQFDIYLVSNDTNVQAQEENNEHALNMIMSSDFKYDKEKHIMVPEHMNIRLRYTTISQHLRDSPLNKYWEYLPYQFTKFLVRAVSLWEKGGIAFDPILLTPQSPHPSYIGKIHKILRKYNSTKKRPTNTQMKIYDSNKFSKSRNTVRKVNNIRDIIDALSDEPENLSEKSNQDSLIEAETINDLTVLNTRRLMFSLGKKEGKNITSEINLKEIKKSPNEPNDKISAESAKEKDRGNAGENNLLPLFLDYLFHNEYTPTTTDKTMTITLRKLYTESKIDLTESHHQTTSAPSLKKKKKVDDMVKIENYKPLIISAKGLFEAKDVIKPIPNPEGEYEYIFELTIDLKGHLIATDTACHALIGAMFTNAIQHDRNESVTDFIIKELSIFCQGLLASCVGIDVVLL